MRHCAAICDCLSHFETNAARRRSTTQGVPANRENLRKTSKKRQNHTPLAPVGRSATTFDGVLARRMRVYPGCLV